MENKPTIQHSRAYDVAQASKTAEQEIYIAISNHDQEKFSSALKMIMSNPFICEINNMLTTSYQTISHRLALSDENLPLLRNFLDVDFKRCMWDSDYKSVDLEAEDAFGNTALIYAIQNNAVDIVKELIKKDASLINQDLLRPVMYFAINSNNPVIVKLLLYNGANLELCDAIDKRKISEYSAALPSDNENIIAIKSMIAEAAEYRESFVRYLPDFDEHPVAMEGSISLEEHCQVPLVSSEQHNTEV